MTRHVRLDEKYGAFSQKSANGGAIAFQMRDEKQIGDEVYDCAGKHRYCKFFIQVIGNKILCPYDIFPCNEKHGRRDQHG